MTLSKTVKRTSGGNRPQSFRDCEFCKKEFLLPHLKRRFCSKKCWYSFKKTIPSEKKGKKYPHLQRARIGNCEICNKEYRAVKDFKDRKQKFCSKKCFHVYWKIVVRPKIVVPGGKIGHENPEWKGDDVGYDGLHRWVARWKGKPSRCEFCDTTTAKRFEWANIDHTYQRELDDFIRLCTSCHRIHDNKWNS